MKHFIGAGVLVVLALIARFWLPPAGLDIYIHDSYWVIRFRGVSFWLLMGIAAVWFMIAAYKFARHSS